MSPRALPLAVPVVLAASSALAATPDLQAERAALFRLDKAWAQAAAARDLEKTVSFWADDARVVPPGQPAVVGKDAIRGYVSSALALPGFSIRWETTDFVVSASGDMAYGFGTNTVTFTGPDGTALTERGRALTVWRKVPGGGWKCVIDIWNAEPSAPAPK
jgi:ketosteroid isomerase-like protein